MGYTMLKNSAGFRPISSYSLDGAALTFLCERCEGLRFDPAVAVQEDFEHGVYLGASLKENEIPYNMQMDIDRLCLENALRRFLKSGKKDDAFDVYFCYLEMFVGDYEKTRRMIELLSEFEANGSGLLMKHRDHYSHSVYVFALGLAIFETNSLFRQTYQTHYHLSDSHRAAHHFLEYWGLASLFHDIGYPFELPFEQVASYFEVSGEDRAGQPFMAYHALEQFVLLNDTARDTLSKLFGGIAFSSTNELFAHSLAQKLGRTYSFAESQMLTYLMEKPTAPNKFNYFMDHAYFSATVLFKKLFEEMECPLHMEHLDALTAILMHNSLYKFCIAHYKDDGNQPLKPELHPLAYLLMLCDELQCWDRTAYGRNSKTELHPMGCIFDLSGDAIAATYLYDEKEQPKVTLFRKKYEVWSAHRQGKAPSLKAYSGMYLGNANGISDFQSDIERIVDLSEIKLYVTTAFAPKVNTGSQNYLSNSNFLNLYRFAMVLNGRWDNAGWKKAKLEGTEEQFIADKDNEKRFSDSFKALSLEYKLSNINQAKAFAKYMDVIGCFYTDKAVDYELLEHFTDEELLQIGVLEHQRWLQEHYDMGWEYGSDDSFPADKQAKKQQRELRRAHWDMIPDYDPHKADISFEDAQANYFRLGKEEQDKDTDPMDCMLAMLRMFDGLRIYRLR